MGLFNSLGLRWLLHRFNRPKHTDAESKNDTSTQASGTEANQHQHVHLISANDNHRDQLTRQLSTWGYHCICVDSAEGYLAQDRFEAVDFIILDSRQLTINALSFAAALKETPQREELTLILIAPLQEKEEQEELKQAGFNFLLSTPLNTRILFTAMQTPYHEADTNRGITHLLDKFHQNQPRVTAKKILLASSEHPILAEMSHTLESEGHLVTTAIDGHRALVALETGVFDLAIMDADLPMLSGIQVINIHHLDCPIKQWIPFILLLEADDNNLEHYHQYSRIKACIKKPVSTPNLKQTLHNLLQQQNQSHRTGLVSSMPSMSAADPHLQQKNTDLIDRSTLQELEKIGSNSDFLGQLIRLFIQDGGIAFGQLRQAVQVKKRSHFKSAAHLLLDSSSLLGTTRLHQLSHTATQVGHDEFLNNADHLLVEIEHTFEATKNALIQYLSEKQSQQQMHRHD